MASDPSSDTSVQGLIDRLTKGDQGAVDALIEHSLGRLRQLTHNRLRSFPRVRRWDETDDVLQNVVLRLRRAVDDVRPTTAAGYFGLASQHIRRELLDLVRHYYGPQGAGANHATDPQQVDRDGKVIPRVEAAADAHTDPTGLHDWEAMHEAAARLPEELRQAFDLVYYNGLSRADAAQVLGISEPTLKRWWREARLQLQERLGKDRPPG